MKLLSKTTLSKWWAEVKDHYHPDDIIKSLQNNRKKIEDYTSKLDGNKFFYRWSVRLFSLFSAIARVADFIFSLVQRALLLLPGVRVIIQKFTDWKNHLNFHEMVEFFRAKLYSLRRHPHNEGDVKLFEEIMEFASKHGFDLKSRAPAALRKFQEKKNQLLQHKFFQEFSKNALEKILAIQFPFDRNIFPVLPDSAFWHKFFEFLERKKVIDIILVNKNEERFSYKKDSTEKIESSDVILILRRLAEIKNKGRRIFFIGHHEGYLGPYFVRSVIRKLGFDQLTKNCNTVVGPRMFSNLVLRNGAANVGNLFITVPSQKTTEIKTGGLADELRKTAKRTQCLIKLPDSGLYLISMLEYNDFMKAFVTGDADTFKEYTSFIDRKHMKELKSYLQTYNFAESMKNFTEEDYNLFKKIMREPFLIFPEGSRSYIDPDKSIVMKYINPKYFDAYMRPGDYIAPINLVGGSDITKGWRLRPALLGISMDDPFEVTAAMIADYENEGLAVMKRIAALPNIKKVRFKDEIQFKKKIDE